MKIKFVKQPKLSTKKIKLILSGKYKKPNKKAFLLALTTAMYACRVAIINAKPCFDDFSKAVKAFEITETALNFAKSVKEISVMR